MVLYNYLFNGSKPKFSFLWSVIMLSEKWGLKNNRIIYTSFSKVQGQFI